MEEAFMQRTATCGSLRASDEGKTVIELAQNTKNTIILFLLLQMLIIMRTEKKMMDVIITETLLMERVLHPFGKIFLK